MLQTEKFLSILAERDLLPAKLLASLRQQVAKSSKPISPELLAKRLTDAGHLTPALAKRLLAALPAPEVESPSAAAPASLPDDDLGLAPLEEDGNLAPLEDELGLAPLEDELGLAPLEEDARPKRSPAPKPSPAAKQPAKPSKQSVQPSKQSAKPPKEPAQKSPGASSPATEPSSSAKGAAAAKPKEGKPVEPAPATSLLDEELAPLDSDAMGTGSLDGLLGAAGMDAAAASAGSPLLTTPAKKKGPFGWLKGGRGGVRRRRENIWDSPLLLISGGLLVGLLILGVVLLWALGRQSGDEALAAANEEYRAGSYAQAIHKFEQFLDRFPNHPGAGSAQVTKGLARLRQATVPGADWSAALAEAQQVLQEIRREDSFGDAGGELASMLPAIAEGLTAQAQKTSDSALLVQAREALELAGNRMNVPTRLQPTAKLEEMEAQLALVERQIHQEAELAAAIADIDKAVAQSDPQSAYDIRRELLREYPTLVHDGALATATRAISAAQQSAVRTTEESVAADSTPPASPVSATITLGERVTRESLSGMDDGVFVTVVAGSAYGIRLTDGQILWQRRLGMAADGLPMPITAVPAAAEASADWFVVSPAANELCRLDASTGQPRWRLPLEGPVAGSPVLAGKSLVVATRAGRLHVIDPESGTSVRQIHLPQPVAVAPAVDAARGIIYQPADHSNLFVLELKSGRCLDVVHLGHAEGSITASPSPASGVLLAPINDRAKTASLRVYGVAESGAETSPSGEVGSGGRLQLLQEFRVRGQLHTSPVVAGRNVVAVTDLGAVYAFELSAADRDKPLISTLQRKETIADPLTCYCLLQGGRLLLADSQLTRFDVRTAEGRLAPRWVSSEDSAFLQAPLLRGDAIIHVRRREGQPGVIVAAVHSDDGRTLWQNRIAVPLAASPILTNGGKQVTAVHSTGAVFRLEIDGLKNDAVHDEPAMTADFFRMPVDTVLEHDDGALLLAAGAGDKHLALCSASDANGRCVQRALPEELACPPSLYAGAVLAPCVPGHLYLYDPQTGEMRAAPFQPALKPGTQLAWNTPAVTEGGRVAVSDGRGTLFSLAMESSPKPHWKAVAHVKLPEALSRPLASIGDLLFVVDQTPAVAAYEMPDLKARESLPLDQPCIWGPVGVGQHILLATAAGRLACYDGSAKRVWEVDLPDSPPAGVAAVDQDRFLVSTAGGVLWWIGAADGQELGRIDVQRPLACAPVAIGRDVVVAGCDGSLYRVEAPE